MKVLVWLIAVLLPLAATAAPPVARAVWIWEQDSYAMLESQQDAEQAFAFLRTKHVDTLYLYADAFQGRNLIVERPEAYRSFIAAAHQRGFKVYALLGSAYLHTERYVRPQRRADAIALLQRVLTYDAKASKESRFDGVNLDIEPHLLDEWNAQKLELLRNFLDVSAAWMELKRESKSELTIGPALPFWFDGIPLDWRGETRPVSEHIADLFDYVALMDYRDHADGRDGIIAHAADEMAYAGKVGKKVVIGLELTPNELAKVTFNHLTEADLRRETAVVERAYRGQSAFDGFAFHHYRGYREWIAAQRRQK
ncbi:MAG TPA: glycoside hydrolase family 18 protein [Lysobacter sp.]|jgi:hypothetical protein|nr:glycoside hydrolase family 18 protein [Lysobacter sp.]